MAQRQGRAGRGGDRAASRRTSRASRSRSWSASSARRGGRAAPSSWRRTRTRYGPSPLGIAAAQAHAGDGEPLSRRRLVRAAAASWRRATASTRAQILVGAGSNEIIDLLVQTFCADGDEVLAPQYSFIAYKLAAEKNRRPFREAPTRADARLRRRRASLGAVTPRTKIVFFANPNNPTGAYLPRAGVRAARRRAAAARAARRRRGLLRVRAAPPTIPTRAQYLGRRARMATLRTFSKIYGLAGLRVGYAVGVGRAASTTSTASGCRSTSARRRRRRRSRRSTTSAHVARARAGNDAELPRLVDGAARARARGAAVADQLHPRRLRRARRARSSTSALLRKGVIVRPMNGYGLPHHLRITVGTARGERAPGGGAAGGACDLRARGAGRLRHDRRLADGGAARGGRGRARGRLRSRRGRTREAARARGLVDEVADDAAAAARGASWWCWRCRCAPRPRCARPSPAPSATRALVTDVGSTKADVRRRGRGGAARSRRASAARIRWPAPRRAGPRRPTRRSSRGGWRC